MLICGPLCLDTAARRLHGPAGDVLLSRSVFPVLRCLMVYPGQVREFDDLGDACWPDVDWPENAVHAVHQRVTEARAAIKAVGGPERAIQNLSGIGYLMQGERRHVRVLTPAEIERLDAVVLVQE